MSISKYNLNRSVRNVEVQSGHYVVETHCTLFGCKLRYFNASKLVMIGFAFFSGTLQVRNDSALSHPATTEELMEL